MTWIFIDMADGMCYNTLWLIDLLKGGAYTMKKAVLIAVSLFLLTSVTDATVPGEKAYRLVTENYTVQDNDTLDSITKHYIVKNTYSKREFHEFRDGIIELNYDIFEKRNIHKGDNLIITYWIPNEDVEDEGTN